MSIFKAVAIYAKKDETMSYDKTITDDTTPTFVIKMQKLSRCSCGYRIRGKNHVNGRHHSIMHPKARNVKP